MKKNITQWIIGICIFLFSSMSLHAQIYDSSEVAALKKVFGTKSADGTNTNGSKIGVADTTNWNPATTPAGGVTWTNINDTLYVTVIDWSNKGMAGSFSGSPLNSLSKLERVNVSNNSFTGLRFGSKFLRELIISGNKTLVVPSFWSANPSAQITNMDSLRIYEAKNTNIGNVNYGTTSFRSLTTLICDSSNVSALTLSTAAGLPNLTTLSTIGNKLTDFTASILAAPLVTVACENNSINQFSKLPLQSSITTYTYAPQKDYWNLGSKYWMDTLDMSSENAVVKGGITRYTTYVWYDITSGTEESIPAGSITESNGKFTFLESLSGKRLRCKMTNNNFSGLTTIAEVVLYGYDAQEMAALKVFFALPSAKADTTNGLALGVTDIANWNPAKQNASLSWTSSGAIRNVQYVNWGQKGVAGNLDLSVFTKIASINIANDQITSVVLNPEMTTMTDFRAESNLLSNVALPTITGKYNLIELQNNKFKFSTLPTNSIKTYRNAPQATINGGEIEYTTPVDLSSEAFVTINGGTAETDYTWVDVTDGTEKSVNGISSTSRGKFTFSEILKGKTLRCKMTNDSLPLFKGDSALRYEVKIKQSLPYDAAEVAAFKDFFRQTGMMSGKTNGEWLGVTNVDNWNPATENAHIEWDNEATKHAITINWTASNLAGKLNLKPMKKLTNISIDKNGIQTVVFADTASLLTNIYSGSSKVDTMTLPKSAPQLSVIQCFNSELSGLVIPSDATKLTDLRVHISKIKTLILPQVSMPELYYLWVYSNELTELVLPPAMPKLRYLYFYNNRITKVTMPTQKMNNLQHMYAEGNALTFATLPTYPKDLTGYSGGIYSATPQDTMKGGTINLTDTIDLSSQYKTTVNGTEAITVYTWYQIVSGNEQSISTGIIDQGNGKFTLAQSMKGKSLRCKMTNANYPEFTNNHQGGIVKTYNTGMVYDVKISGNEAIDRADANHIRIYPNPAKTIVNVEGISIQKIEIYNTLGSLLSTQMSKSPQINISGLQEGVHILKIYTTRGEVINKQIIIVK